MRSTIPTPTAGETVARAKRTERAEARRRYRAAAAAEAEFEADEGAPSPSTGRASAAQPQREGPPRRRPSGWASAGRVPGRRSARSTSATTWPPCPGSRPTPRRSGCRCAITLGQHGRDHRRDERWRHLAVHVRVLHPDAGDRRRVHRRLPGAARELAARRDRRALLGDLLLRARPGVSDDDLRDAAPPTQAQARRSCSRPSSCRRSSAPSSRPAPPGTGASCGCRARTGPRPAQKSNAKKMGDGRTRGGTTAKASAKR